MSDGTLRLTFEATFDDHEDFMTLCVLLGK